MYVAVAHRRSKSQQVPATDDSHWRSGWSALAVTALSRAVLVTLASLLLWSVAPAAIGWHSTVVMSGSMAPQLNTGDVVASRPATPDKLRLGQVLLATDPDHAGHLRMHRLVAVRPDGLLTTRGDANRADDSTPISRDAVKGVGSLRSPWIGTPAYLLRTRQTVLLIPILAGLALLLLGAFTFRPDEEDDESRGSASGARVAADAPPRTYTRFRPPRALAHSKYAARHSSRVVAWRRPVRLILVSLGICAITTGIALPARASSSFIATATSTGDNWSAKKYFSCASAVIADDPFYLYPLGEQSGNTVADASGNSRTGSYQPSRSAGTSGTTAGPCRNSRATTLNGTSGYVSTPTKIANPNNFSMEIWFKTGTGSGGALMGFSDTQTGAENSAWDRVLYLTDYGQLVFGVYPGRVAYVNSQQRVNDDTWHLATATLSSAGMRLYLDGALVDSDSTVTTGRNYSGYFQIGHNKLQGYRAAPSGDFLNASLYNAAVFSGALTATQVSDHYTARS